MSVADILERLAENAGNSRRLRGQILGDVVSQAAQVPAQILNDRERHALLLRQQAQQDAIAGYARNKDARDASDQALQEAAAKTAQQDRADWRQVTGALYRPGGTLDYDAAAAKAHEIGRPDLVETLNKHKTDNVVKPLILKEGETGFDPVTQAPIPGLSVSPKPPAHTAEMDDQRYRNIQARLAQKFQIPPDDQAWADAYEKQKTLGVDKSAGAAADRQATAITAAAAGQERTQRQQIAQQQRAQEFNVAQVARKDLTVVEKTYTDAQSAANQLRDSIDAAQGGNKMAASMLNLQTAMATVKAAGFNRINMAEIGIPGTAGSFLDRVASRLGTLTAGQPVPADLQADMRKVADLLEKTAYSKYADGFDAVAKFYGLTDQQKSLKLAAPSGTNPGDVGLSPGLAGLAGRK